MPDIAKLEEIVATLEAAQERRLYRKMDFFEPYPKQQEFFDAGIGYTDRLFMAGNQLGKTYAGAFETACHLTGDYPDWWMGKRFSKPTRGWACGISSLLVRDTAQKLLCGEPGVEAAYGTGMVPKSAFLDRPSMARGVTDAYDTIQVRHASGGISILRFKSYEQGREKFQGETLDFCWLDEEPPVEIYSEIRTRMVSTGVCLYVTFTPLKGMSNVVAMFLNEPENWRHVTIMTIDDALHFSDEERKQVIASYPVHEREARARGVPMMGEGRVFPISEEAISEFPIDLDRIPSYWPKLWGLDFGIGHPFAAALMAWDRDNDVIHILHTIRIKDGLPINHAAALKPIGVNVPVAWPHDGTDREKGSGVPLATLYRQQGLTMLPEHATHPDGGYSTEAGIAEMLERMQVGKFKVAAHLSDFFEEFRLYHRKNGQIVKERDDIMSATRVAVMAKRFARLVPLGGWKKRRGGQGAVALDVDFDTD